MAHSQFDSDETYELFDKAASAFSSNLVVWGYARLRHAVVMENREPPVRSSTDLSRLVHPANGSSLHNNAGTIESSNGPRQIGYDVGTENSNIVRAILQSDVRKFPNTGTHEVTNMW